jgi:hypothetical protein
MAAPTDEELVEILKTAIETRLAGGAVRSYTISGRNIQYEGLDVLEKLLDKYEKRVAAKRSKTTYARFDNPS